MISYLAYCQIWLNHFFNEFSLLWLYIMLHKIENWTPKFFKGIFCRKILLFSKNLSNYVIYTYAYLYIILNFSRSYMKFQQVANNIEACLITLTCIFYLKPYLAKFSYGRLPFQLHHKIGGGKKKEKKTLWDSTALKIEK